MGGLRSPLTFPEVFLIRRLVRCSRSVRRYVLKRLWDGIPAVDRYSRCKQCGELVHVYLSDGSYDKESLREHVGHHLGQVRSLSLSEWLRVRVEA